MKDLLNQGSTNSHGAPVSVLGAGDTAVNEADKALPSCSRYSGGVEANTK